MTTSRINPDSRAVLVVATVATAALALVSFLLSFNGLADAASWANVPGWLSWAIPAYVDGAILVYTLAALVFRARGESARLEWTALGVFAALSVAANGVHAWATAPAWLQATLGVLLAALAPVSVVITTHTIARLVVAPPALEEPAQELSDEGLEELAVYAAEDVERTRSLWADHRADVLARPVDEHADDAVDHLEPTPFAPETLEAIAEEPEPDPIAERNARIRELDAEGKSLRAIAAEVGVSKSTVSRVLGRHPDEPRVNAAA
ncbi:helix-turn-helix DNA binding domain protein [Microbacterium phage Caron]|uniref:Helix-turn-helix DNA binding domain protein n=1 Tax=Microbacterium phage Caron TaxID=3028494 RepID=A0AAF0CDU8_9CAUD|nr:helix-turn-helix DNA binding domain protein [Microbacterium phage Caron]